MFPKARTAPDGDQSWASVVGISRSIEQMIRNDCQNCSTISMNWKKLAGEPGFEPGLTESESAGLPLTYSPVTACGGGRVLPFGIRILQLVAVRPVFRRRTPVNGLPCSVVIRENQPTPLSVFDRLVDENPEPSQTLRPFRYFGAGRAHFKPSILARGCTGANPLGSRLDRRQGFGAPRGANGGDTGGLVSMSLNREGGFLVTSYICGRSSGSGGSARRAAFQGGGCARGGRKTRANVPSGSAMMAVHVPMRDCGDMGTFDA